MKVDEAEGKEDAEEMELPQRHREHGVRTGMKKIDGWDRGHSSRQENSSVKNCLLYPIRIALLERCTFFRYE
jgi:hypothetical protein